MNVMICDVPMTEVVSERPDN